MKGLTILLVPLFFICNYSVCNEIYYTEQDTDTIIVKQDTVINKNYYITRR